MQSLGEIEAAIVHDPDDVELRRVYADALQERSDPRGEHIALTFLADGGDEVAAAKVRGIERAAAVRMTKKLNKDFVVRLYWSQGFVDHVDIDTRSYADKFPRLKLAALLAEPELRAVQSFDLRGIWNSDWNVTRMVESLPELFANKPIRWLGIGDGAIEASHLLHLRKAFPRLDGLGVLTTKPRMALPGLKGLRDVEIASHELTTSKLVAATYLELRETGGPALERLVFHGLGERIPAAKFEPLLSGEVFPQLKHLGLFGSHELTWDVWRRIIDCPLKERLESFGFVASDMWDDEESEAWIKEHGKALHEVELFTSAEWPDEDNGHESGRLGQILKSVSRSTEAIPEIEHHLQFSGDDSDHFGCWEELAEAMVWAGRAEEALEPLEQGIRVFEDKVSDDSIFTFRTKAEALDGLSRWDEALAVLDRTLEFDKTNSWTHRSKGRALRELERYDEALVAFDLAVETARSQNADDPEILAWAHVELGRTLWQMRRIDDAIAAFDTARDTKDPTATRASSWARGAIENQRGNPRDAIPWLRAASELQLPDDQESPLYELGETLFELGDFTEALEVWKHGASAFGSWRDIDEQGYALLALGKPTDALLAIEASPAEKGGARAIILHALGRTDEAIAAVEDYAHRPGLTEPVCAYRHVAGRLLQGVLHRVAGREDEARAAFADARRAPHDPRELHAAIAKELGGVDGHSAKDLGDDCHKDTCGRPAAIVGIAAALALGDRADALARARELARIVDAGSARLMPMRVWEVRGVLPMLGNDPLLAALLQVVERCAGGAAFSERVR